MHRLTVKYQLKSVILPYKVNCFMRHNLKVFFILTICSENFFILFKIFIKRKMNNKYVLAIKVNTFHTTECHPRDTPFRTPIPVISHFASLGFNPDKFEMECNSFINSIIDVICCHLHKRCTKIDVERSLNLYPWGYF